MAHCNLHLGAIFVSEKTWLWKVAGMEAACPLNKLDAKVPMHTRACVLRVAHRVGGNLYSVDAKCITYHTTRQSLGIV